MIRSTDEAADQLKLLHTADGNGKGSRRFRKKFGNFLEN